jgi:hypothetical protein
MSKKWYNLFVSVENPTGQAASSPTGPDAESVAPPPPSAAQAIADIASSVAHETKFTSPVATSSSFDQIYAAAEIQPPPHGFTIMKVADMLRSEHIRNAPRDVKKTSVLVALEAAGAPVQDVIQDAVKRDRALDTFERVQEKSVAELEARKTRENKEIQDDLDKIITEHRTRMQANSDEISREKERFHTWRVKKQDEEQKIADAVSYFVTDNPITTGGPAASPGPSRAAEK